MSKTAQVDALSKEQAREYVPKFSTELLFLNLLTTGLDLQGNWEIVLPI